MARYTLDRLSIVLTLAVGAVVTGVLVIAVLTLGYYAWPVILGAVVVGFLLTWPTSYWISRRIKRRDPMCDAKRGATARRPVPSDEHPEV